MGRTVSVLEGSMAVAHAVRSCGTDVIAAYPISPQTHIVEFLAGFAADGSLPGKYVNADSEFSAASIVYGAAAAGARAYTASSSQGLLLMTEVLYNIAGKRLPAVFTGVNRTVSPPISIQPDHQDTMALRDTGFIHLHAESIQEAYDAHIQAFKISEDHRVLLPVIVCIDGWALTHAFQPVTTFDDSDVQAFLGGRIKPYQYLNPKDEDPVTYGGFDDEKLMEYKYLAAQAQKKAGSVIEDVALDYKEKFGFYNGGLIDTYRTEDAEVILIAMGSAVSAVRIAVDRLRSEGKKVGLLKIRCYRPFPEANIVGACRNARVLGVIDKSVSASSGGIVGAEVRSAFCNQETAPLIKNYIAVGGRELNIETIQNIFTDAEKVTKANIKDEDSLYVNLYTQYTE